MNKINKAKVEIPEWQTALTLSYDADGNIKKDEYLRGYYKRIGLIK